MLPPAAFMNYATFDDKNDEGLLSNIREKLSREVRALTGAEFQIFQDKKDISWGQEWQKRIDSSLETSTFLVAFITPSFLNSKYCREELERFLEKESRLGLSELFLPIYYIRCDQIEEQTLISDYLVTEISKRQMFSWVSGSRLSM
ncbi:MAG: toll/interleukin-1 receptor domain-containing protein [Leptolyngbyaceae cyanobacterium]